VRYASTLPVTLFAFGAITYALSASATAQAPPEEAPSAQATPVQATPAQATPVPATPVPSDPCEMSLASVYRRADGAYAVTVRAVDEDGGVIRIAFKGPKTLQVTAALPAVTPRGAGDAFNSDPIPVGPPFAGADTVEVWLLGTRKPELTCAVGAMPLASVPPQPGTLGIESRPFPLLVAYDLSTCGTTGDPGNADAHKIADSPLPFYHGTRGSSTVRVQIDDEGNVERAVIIRTDDANTNRPSLDTAALMTFAPQILACKPRGGVYRVIINY
jgi:hypothetical protein